VGVDRKWEWTVSGRVGLRKWESRAVLPQVLSGTEDNNERSPAAGGRRWRWPMTVPRYSSRAALAGRQW
jgi:hypothetical protein